MSTSTDFNQIRKIIREEIENETSSLKLDLGHDIRMSRIEIQNDIHEVKNRIKNLEIRISRNNHEEIDEEDDI